MKDFSVSRIHTNKGIFRLKGSIESTKSGKQLNFSKVEFMGTDGWLEIDLESTHTLAILAEIKDVVLQHVTR